MSELDNPAIATDTVAQTPGVQPASGEDSAATPPATTGDSSADTQDGSKPEASIQKRINRLTRQRGEAERRADRLAAELDDIRKEVSSLKHQTRSAELDPKDFGDYPSYLKAQARQEATAAARAEIEAGNRTRAAQDTHRQLQGLHDTFIEKATEQAEATGIDMEAVMETLVTAPNLSVTVMERLAESEHSARLAEFLAENPSELERVSRLGPTLATRALDKIEAAFQPKSGSARTSTKAPAPPKTVGGRAVMTPAPADMDIETYKAQVFDVRQKRIADA